METLTVEGSTCKIKQVDFEAWEIYRNGEHVATRRTLATARHYVEVLESKTTPRTIRQCAHCKRIWSSIGLWIEDVAGLTDMFTVTHGMCYDCGCKEAWDFYGPGEEYENIKRRMYEIEEQQRLELYLEEESGVTV